MDSTFQKLKDLFISDPPSAIEECQKIILSVSNFDSYEEFYSYHLENAHTSTCSNEWSTTQACIFCKNCAEVSDSCICLPCFLNGNHKGHDYIINQTTGNCDCGDNAYWKKSGFCSKHHGLEPNENPENYLDEKLRTTLTDVIFKAAFTSLKNFAIDNSENASKILQFISSFLKFGDGFRRLISISLTERFDLEDLMSGIVGYSSSFNASLQQLLGRLINDQHFLGNYSKISYDIISKYVIKDTLTIMREGSDNISYGVWNRFWFHSFSKHCVQNSIEKFNWDWVTFGITTISYFMELFNFVGEENFNEIPKLLLTIANRMKNATYIQPNEQTQQFFDQLIDHILLPAIQAENNAIIVTSFKYLTSNAHYIPIYYYHLCFLPVFNSFQNKPALKYDGLFEILNRTIDISPIFMIGMNKIGDNEENENDRFVSKIIGKNEGENCQIQPSNYLSFHNGSSFIFTHPLYDLLNYLFENDELSKIKIARLLSTENYQSLRVKLGIITLKSILSFLCSRQSITPQENSGLLLLYKLYNEEKMISNSYNKFVPFFQLLIGLQGKEKTANDEFGLKEFFAFEMAREIGIFDDFSSHEYDDENINEKKKQMVFTFLFLSLLLVTERKLFHLDGMTFLKEQIIFSLKKGIHSIEELDELNDYTSISSFQHTFAFNDTLMEVAKTLNSKEENGNDDDESNNKEMLFYLKDDVEHNPISAINLINDQMTIMNSEISKQPDKLLHIPSFEPEETFFFNKTEAENNNNNNFNTDGLNVHLKQFLYTPTVLALVYNILRNDQKSDTPSSDLNDHLAMNIIVLIAKFVKEESSATTTTKIFDESAEIQYDCLVDFIKKLKTVLFNYNVDEEGNATIENTLNEANFAKLLKLKISSKDLPQKSFVDLLLEKGKLGHNVLQQITSYVQFDFVGKEEEEKQVNEKDTKAEKRKKASKLKEDIMNQFKDMISNYSQKGADSIDAISSISNSLTLDEEQEVCSICSMSKKNEITSFPLYIYRTKFPFIIDKPPLVSKDVKDRAVDDVIDDFDPIEINEEEENNEEENNEANHDEIMRMIFQNFPMLESTEGLDERQLEQRFQLIEMLYGTLGGRLSHGNKKKSNANLVKYIKERSKEYQKSLENKQFKRCTTGANFILQFNLCQHSVHQSCVKEIPFTCPVDRSKKNSLLPSVEMIPITMIFKDLKTFELYPNEDESLHQSIVNSITSFIDSFSSFFDCVNDRNINIFIELVKSISALISTFEIRLRSLPDCLDSEKTKSLARNLFLTAWYAYRIKGKPTMNENEEIESKLTLFQRLIKKLIESDTIAIGANKEKEFKGIVSDLLNSNDLSKLLHSDLNSKEKLICLFLRRSCLAEHFLLNVDISPNSITEIIDWDEVFLPSNLVQRYGYQLSTIDYENGEEIDFKPFTFSNLPKEFIRLYEKPFCFPIEKVTKSFYFNMIDYNYLINHYDEVSGEIVDESLDDLTENNRRNLFNSVSSFFQSRHSPSLLLLVGKDASKVLLLDRSYRTALNTFYVDRYGCTDIGYKRSQPLFFNEEKFEKCIDAFLSGDFANSLRPGFSSF